VHDRDGKRSKKLVELVDQADRKGLDFDGLRELARLYRAESSRLSQLRRQGHDREEIRYLNAVCLRAYSHVYAPPPRFGRHRWLWLRGIPDALSRTARLQAVAVVLLALGAWVAAQIVAEDPANLGATVPAAMYDEAGLHELFESAEARRSFLARREVSGVWKSIFASSLFAHNTRVGVLSFATGILAGIPTVLLLVYNGLTLGGFAAIFLRSAEWLEFLAWIIPHAVPELLAIVLCSTGGLAMGLAVVAPGRLGRAVALRAAARDALHLVIAALPLFLVAAMIESFVRESLLSTSARFVVAAMAVLALFAYAAFCRWHATRQEHVDTSFLR
jgi:uncharacterized membrane protein SpoIIM required for sporulation